MIYDCFIFYNELELLELRLAELCSKVDKFVLVEAKKKFNGQEKPLFYLENQAQFARFNDKIIHVVVDDFPETSNAWVREITQRNAVLRGLDNARPDDITLISDVDEIPKIENIINGISETDIHHLKQRFFYYKFNLLRGFSSRAIACKFKNLSITPHEARMLHSASLIEDAGWHFSYLMDELRISDKIQSFSHQEFNKEEYYNAEKIKDRVDNNQDLFGRKNKEMKIVELDSSFPSYLLNNMNKYKDFIG